MAKLESGFSPVPELSRAFEWCTTPYVRLKVAQGSGGMSLLLRGARLSSTKTHAHRARGCLSCRRTGRALGSVGTGCQSESYLMLLVWEELASHEEDCCCVAVAVQAFLTWSPRTAALAPQFSGHSGSNSSYSTQGQLVTVAEQGFSPASVRGRVGKRACSWHRMAHGQCGSSGTGRTCG